MQGIIILKATKCQWTARFSFLENMISDLSVFIPKENLCGNVVRSSMEVSKSGTTVHVFPKAIKFAGTHLYIPSDMRNEPCVWLCLMDAVGVQLA